MPKSKHMSIDIKPLEAKVVCTDMIDIGMISVSFVPASPKTDIYLKRWKDKNNLPKIDDRILVERVPMKRKGFSESHYFAIRFAKNEGE